MTDTPPRPDETSYGQSVRILGLVCVGHALSNFYILCLPPLIPFLKAEFGVSYAALGAMLSARSFAAGIMQVPMGFLVDRLGAKAVLVMGLVLMSAGFGLIAFVPGYWWTLAMTSLLGLGMATLRPANYTIINASMPPSWMGRSFGANVFSGHVGRAVAPPVIVFLAALWDWRAAVAVCGAGGIVVTAGLITQWRIVRDDTRPAPGQPAAGAGLTAQFRLFGSRTVLLFFAFYILTALVTNGIHSFTVVALTELHATPLAVASSALTGFLVASAAGVLAGGFLADRTARHELVAVAALAASAVLIMALATVSLPAVVIIATLTAVGLFQGTVRPARDMLIRAVLPRASFGKAIGMVSSGAAFGGAFAPVLFGWIMDIGEAEWVFYLFALGIALVALTIMVPKERVGAPG